jgi:hypothetical protein
MQPDHIAALVDFGVLADWMDGGLPSRAFAGKAPKRVGDLLHATTLGLFARARIFMEA